MSELPSGRQSVYVVGLDFGSTTSRAIVASAVLERNPVTDRMQLGQPQVVFRSEPVFTPFQGQKLSEPAINQLLEKWLAECGIDQEQFFAGGVIITGLAAEKSNASHIVNRVRKHIKQLIVASADDPGIESWFAFMGNSIDLSHAEPERAFINLDIGGGTTNPAMAVDGNVSDLGCYYIGARHLQFIPGTYQVTSISSHGEALCRRLGLSVQAGDELDEETVDRITGEYVACLERLVIASNQSKNTSGDLEAVCQIPFTPAEEALENQPVITFSGGVGELLYKHVQQQPLPGLTAYGDLGINLCLKIAESTVLNRNLHSHQPANGGRATVFGLALHSSELSGNTLFLSNPDQLPVNDLPIVARVPLCAESELLKDTIKLAKRSHHGACFHITLIDDKYPSFKELKAFGQTLSDIIEEESFPPDLPLLLLVPKDFGKVIGNYVSCWGKLPVNLMVIDEIPDSRAGFVSVGRPHNYYIPVYFYGLQ